MCSAGPATLLSPPPITAMVGTCGCGGATGGGGVTRATCCFGCDSAACAAASSRRGCTSDARAAGPPAFAAAGACGMDCGGVGGTLIVWPVDCAVLVVAAAFVSTMGDVGGAGGVTTGGTVAGADVVVATALLAFDVDGVSLDALAAGVPRYC